MAKIYGTGPNPPVSRLASGPARVVSGYPATSAQAFPRKRFVKYFTSYRPGPPLPVTHIDSGTPTGGGQARCDMSAALQ